MKKIFSALLIAALIIPAFTSCKNEDEALPEATGAKFETTSMSLYIGQTKHIDVNYTPAKANTSNAVWISRDETKASVTGGYVTGLLNGDVRIVLGLKKGSTVVLLDSLNVKVEKHDVTSLTLDKTDITVIKGKTATINATVGPENASLKTVTWTSSNEKVATVDKDGVVSGVTKGSAVITAKADEKTATCKVTVIEADSFDIATDASAGSTKIVGGDQVDIKAEGNDFLSYTKATQTVSWSENTTGKVRSQKLTLDSGSEITVTQAPVKASSLMGQYQFNSKIFTKNAAKSGVTAADNGTISVKFEAPLKGETLNDVNGKTYTNTIGIKGLIDGVTVDATVIGAGEGTKVGVFMDGRTAQKCAKGKDGFEYIAVLPGLGQGFISANYNFLPSPITAEQNYCWIWFDLDKDGKTLRYANGNKQKLTNNGTEYYVIAISLVPCKTEKIEASKLDSAWWVVYQANPGNNVTNGLSFTKN